MKNNEELEDIGMSEYERQKYFEREIYKEIDFKLNEKLINRGFERIGTGNIPNNWTKWMDMSVPAVWAVTNPRPGSSGAKATRVHSFVAEDGGEALLMQGFDVVPGKSYKFSGWMVSSGISGTQGRASFRLRWNDVNGNAIQRDNIASDVSGTTPWTYYEMTIVCPVNAARCIVNIGIDNAIGYAAHDDISVIEL